MEVPLATVCRLIGAPAFDHLSPALPRGSPRVPARAQDRDQRRCAHREDQSGDRDSPFAGEGHRKVRAHLRRDHELHIGKNRVLRLMRRAGLLAPQGQSHGFTRAR